MAGNNTTISSYKNLEVWKRADVLAYKVYQLAKSFPKEELYGLTSQLRRAALSVPTNIVEGWSRRGTKEFIQFINTAIGSCTETEYLLGFSQKLSHASPAQIEPLIEENVIVLKMLRAFIKSLKAKTE